MLLTAYIVNHLDNTLLGFQSLYRNLHSLLFELLLIYYNFRKNPVANSAIIKIITNCIAA